MKKWKPAEAAAATVALAVLMGTPGGEAPYAQQAALKRTILQRGDLSVQGREVVMAVGEVPPGAAAGKHTHPGQEVCYVLEGSLVLEVPAKTTKTLKDGVVFMVSPGQVHDGTNNDA